MRTVAIRLTNWVGDCVMNTPFLSRVRTLFPNARIVLFGRKNVTQLFQPHPFADAVETIDDKSAKGFLEAVRRVRSYRPDLGFLLPNSLKAAALFAAAGVKARVGYDRDGRRFLLTHPVPLRPDDLGIHEVQYYLRLLNFWESGARVPDPMVLAVSQNERDAMERWLQERGIGPQDFIVGVNPAAFYGTAKRYLPERFAAAAQHFVKTRNAFAVTTGLPTERDVADQVCHAGGDRFINGAGEMSLRELMAFLARVNIYLTNDSGAMHIAAALGAPVVAVFGSTDWVTTAPLSPRARIVRVDTACAPCLLRHCPIDHRCMTKIPASMVIEAGEKLLEDSSS